jgi:hypothetical protein
MMARVPDGPVAHKAGTAHATDIRAQPRLAHNDRSGLAAVGTRRGRLGAPGVHAVAAGVCDRDRGRLAAGAVADPTGAGRPWLGAWWAADDAAVVRPCPQVMVGGGGSVSAPRADVRDAACGWQIDGRSRAGDAAILQTHWRWDARTPQPALLPNPRTTWAVQSGLPRRLQRASAGRPATSRGTNGSSRSAIPPRR